MQKFRAFWIRLKGLVHPGRGYQDISNEIESHIAITRVARVETQA